MTNEQGSKPFELNAPPETGRIKITPKALFDDNRSELAHDNMIAWDLNRFDGNHIVVATCADSRLEIPMDKSVERVHTIAVGGPKEPYHNLLGGKNVQAAVALAHHDGDTVVIGEMPTGCGGEGAKAEIKKHGTNGGSPIETYIDQDVYHEDVIVQSCVSALEIASFTDKPVLAATQDHVTGEIIPLLAFWKDRSASHAIWDSSISIQDLLDPKKYDPKKIYARGIPRLNIQSLPSVFQELLKTNREEVETLHDRYPNYHDLQKNQNPHTIVLTTDIRPTRLKYPTTFDELGSFFRLTIPRIKDTSGEDVGVEILPEEIERVFNQLEYPIAHFSNVENIIIESPSYDWSTRIGQLLIHQEYMQEWLKKEGAQIIAAGTRGGKRYQPTALDLNH